jgi:hypothetical protein
MINKIQSTLYKKITFTITEYYICIFEMRIKKTFKENKNYFNDLLIKLYAIQTWMDHS